MPRARIVFAWEWGTASGHLRRFRPLAAALVQAGCDVVLVVREPERAADVFQEFELPVLACPSLGSPPPAPCRHPCSIAGLAWNLGVNDVSRVYTAIKQWKHLLMAVRPTHLITDFGLLAGVVANSLGIPTARIGTGFGVPPEDQTLASMFGEPISTAELEIACLRRQPVANR